MVKREKKPRKPKFVEREVSISDLIDEVHNDAEELGQELRDWYDGMPESIQGSRDDIDEAADHLENLNKPDVPERFEKLMLKFQESTKLPRSRSDRRYAATANLDALIQALEVTQENGTFSGAVVPVGEDPEAFKSELEQFLSDLSDYKDELENAGFPGRNA